MVGPIYGVGAVGPQMGYIRQGTIRDYDVQTGKVLVSFTLAKSSGITEDKILMPIPASWVGPNGEFSGGFPPRGLPPLGGAGGPPLGRLPPGALGGSLLRGHLSIRFVALRLIPC